MRTTGRLAGHVAGHPLRHLTRALAILAFFLILHYVLVPQLGGIQQSISVISHLQPPLVGAAILSEALSLAAYAQMTRTLLPAGQRPGLMVVLRIQLATLGMSHVVPGGTATSTPLAYRMLRRSGVGAADAGFVLATQPVVSAAVLNGFLLVGLLVSIPLRRANTAHLTTSLVGLVVIGFGALLLFALARGAGPLDRGVHWIGRRTRYVDANRIASLVQTFSARVKLLAADPRLLAKAGGWAAVQWLTDAASLWIFLAALGERTPADTLLIAFALANVSAVIPLTPGGIGVYEAILTASLVGFGVHKPVAIVGVLAYRIVEFWLPIPVGVAAYVSAGLGDGDGDNEPDRIGPPANLTRGAAR